MTWLALLIGLALWCAASFVFTLGWIGSKMMCEWSRKK